MPTQTIEVELGEADLRLERGRDLYPIILSGTESAGMEYGHMEVALYGLKRAGVRQGLSGDLLAVVPRAARLEYSDDAERVTVGRGVASYYIDDGVLVLDNAVPADRPEAEQVELSALFDQFARSHYPDATTVYRLETPFTGRSVLHQLGYHLAFTARRRSDGRHVAYPPRVWTR